MIDRRREETRASLRRHLVRGTALDRYEIIGELGHGGMSVVYRALDRQLNRFVAVKVLHEFLSRQPDARRRFHREAVAVAKLKHPGILEIFDYSGPEAEEAFIVTELIEGETLREWVDRRGKPTFPELAALIVAELVRALRHAHEQSVIHRDLKPENVMLNREGGIKLMDFGLAQLMDGGTKLTATGTLLGSPAHMAPEVIDGKASDARADLFSMGTILYWLAVGRLPFEAPNPSALFKKILDGRYDDPQMIEPRIGNGLARIIQRALEPDPDKRYQDVTEMAADLDVELGAVGLAPSEIYARLYLRDPIEFAKEFEPRLVATLTTAGKQALTQGNVARAMDRFNRVLAIDPSNEAASAEVARVGREKTLRRRVRQLVLVAGLGTILVSGGVGAIRFLSDERLAPRTQAPEELRPSGPPPQVYAPSASASVVIPASTASVAHAEALGTDVREVPLRPATELDAMPSSPKSPKDSPIPRVPAREALREPRASARLATSTEPPISRTTPRSNPPGGAGPAPPIEPPAPFEARPRVQDDVIHQPLRPPEARLRVVIGGGVASRLRVDNEAKPFNGYVGAFVLTPGAHEIEAESPAGQRVRVQLRASEAGDISEVGPDGSAIPLSGNELRIKIAKE